MRNKPKAWRARRNGATRSDSGRISSQRRR